MQCNNHENKNKTNSYFQKEKEKRKEKEKAIQTLPLSYYLPTYLQFYPIGTYPSPPMASMTPMTPNSSIPITPSAVSYYSDFINPNITSVYARHLCIYNSLHHPNVHLYPGKGT